MKYLHTLVWPALIAGIVAGFALSAVQQFTVTPIILEAETYEVSDQDDATHEEGEHGDSDGHTHSHGESEGWAPADGFERMFYTYVVNMLLGFGYGLILLVAMALHQFRKSESSQTISKVLLAGLWWGLAGYAVFQLAPALGLPPALPGKIAANIEARQIWWIVCVLLTAVGLVYLVFTSSNWYRGLGVIMLLVPHMIGAPSSPQVEGLVPQELINSFIWVSLLTSLLFWVILGLVATVSSRNFMKGLDPQGLADDS